MRTSGPLGIPPVSLSAPAPAARTTRGSESASPAEPAPARENLRAVDRVDAAIGENRTFVVDGHVITVSASDSIQAVLARINGSGARVIATYDAVADRIVLENTYASEDDAPGENPRAPSTGRAAKQVAAERAYASLRAIVSRTPGPS